MRAKNSMKLIGSYKNGNYSVRLFSDGTKERITEDDEFIPSFAENCDVKITDKCDGGCPWCYEGCTENGKHGEILNYKFIETLHPFTELALNGNDMSHPDLIPFLKILKKKKVIANLTVNQKHFDQHYELLKALSDKGLIHGLGVSLVNPTEDFICKVKHIPNIVIHVINGIVTGEQLTALADHDLKLLILGYKYLRRGDDYFRKQSDDVDVNQAILSMSLRQVFQQFEVVSFDNLGIEQMNIRRFMTKEQWDEFYMGDDGKYTFYIDLVEGTFSKNSLSQVKYPIMDSIDKMFGKIVNVESGSLATTGSDRTNG